MKRYPIQSILVTVFVSLVFFSVAVTGYVSFKNGQRAVNAVSRHLRDEITSRIQDHLTAFLAIPHRINQLNANAISHGETEIEDVPALERLFWNQVKIYDSVTSIYFGNTDGGLVNAGREGSAGNLYVISTDGFKRGPFRKSATDNSGNPTRELLVVQDFDARTRPWYTGAVQKKAATWSDIYVLFTGQDMATAASVPIYDQQDRLLGVVAVDLFLSHISDFLKRLKIGKTGQAFIMERSGLMVAASTPGKLFSRPNPQTAPKRFSALESESPLIRHAAEVLSTRFGDNFSIAGTQHLEFRIQGKRHFLQVSLINDEYGLEWLVVVVIPEMDFMAKIYQNNSITAILIFGFLTITIVIGIIAAQKISQPISQLNTTARSLATEIGNTHVPETSRILEISELTKSFNQMTRQLRQMLKRLTAEIAEHDKAEKALRISEERLELVLRGANLGLWDWNVKTGEVIFNDRWAEIIGYTLDELEPNVSSWEKIIHPDDVEPVMIALNDHLEGRAPNYQTEHRLRTKSGEWKWIFDSGKVFTRDDQGLPCRALGILQDITDRKRAEERLHNTLKEKEVLLQEIHHRVKNNLAIMISLLNLQAKRSQDDNVSNYLTESQSRLMTMAAIHETLYQAKDFSVIQFKDYIRKIVSNLISLYASEADHISIHYDLEEVHLDIDQAVCCGLIVNELVTNALKYAFPGLVKGKIVLHSSCTQDDEIIIGVSDDGVGLPQGLDWEAPRTLGLRLISLMVEQLNGHLEITSERGLKTVIRWERKTQGERLAVSD